MDRLLQGPGFALVTALAMLAGFVVGRVLRRGARAGAANDAASSDALEAAVFALLGLLLAFTFSGAMTRFDRQRDLITQEANAIGTAYLRLDLLPEDRRPVLRELFRKYVEARIATYRGLDEGEINSGHYAESVRLQGEIWSQALAAANAAPQPQALALEIPALNDMIDVTTTRYATLQAHPPQAIYLMLLGVALVASLLVGYRRARGGLMPSLPVVAFVVVTAATIAVICDIEYPRRGLVRIDASDQLLATVLAGMH